MDDYYGLPIIKLSSPVLKLECLSTAGPRIARLRYKDSENLFAELPDNVTQTPYGDYHYFGGHRLWHAPEAMPRSYIPDNDGLNVKSIPNGLLLDGKIEPGTGIHKQIEVQLDPERPIVYLTHTLINENLWEIQLAPWAITMFRLGGVVVMPLLSEDQGTDGLLPNRNLSLWPYSRITDPRLYLDDDFIVLKASENFPPFKIGCYNSRGWIAYYLDGILFRKSFEIFSNKTYPDFGCNSETYSDSEFVELESLAPLVKLAPGESVNHVETWEIFDSLDQDFLPLKIINFLRS